MKAIYWRLRIMIFSLRWIPRFNIGDRVWYQGRVWRLSQGVKSPIWTLRDGNEAVEAPESQFAKVKSVSNYWGSFKSGYRFYMRNWYSIWLRDGIEPWVKDLKKVLP